ncbi:unnamed protein product, partial [Ectocarpus fasciculatus]
MGLWWLLLPVCGLVVRHTCEAATVKIGFLVDWGLGSPLYPAVAQAAAQAAARGFGDSGGVFTRGDRVE